MGKLKVLTFNSSDSKIASEVLSDLLEMMIDNRKETFSVL